MMESAAGEFVKDVKGESQSTTIPLESPSPKDDLATLGAVELLDSDDRPVFILDLTSATKTIPVYYNASFREVPLLESKVGKATGARDPKYNVFMDWATSRYNEGSLLQTTYCGVRWTAKVLRSRWRVVSGDSKNHTALLNIQRRQSAIPRIGRSQTAAIDSHERSRYTQRSTILDDNLEDQLAAFRLRREEDIPTFPSPAPQIESSIEDHEETEPDTTRHIDFTRPNTTKSITPHMQFILDFDWASTGLGAIEFWSPELRRMVNMLMTDPRPAAMYWGRNKTMLYNM